MKIVVPESAGYGGREDRRARNRALHRPFRPRRSSQPELDHDDSVPNAKGWARLPVIGADARSLFRELDRVVDDLRRGGGVVRFPGRHPRQVADAVHLLAQTLADAAADGYGDPRRDVPRLGDAAVADQITVIGRELRNAVAETAAVDVHNAGRSVHAVRELMLRGVPR